MILWVCSSWVIDMEASRTRKRRKKRKRLEVDIFGQEKVFIGTFPSEQHADIRTLIVKYTREVRGKGRAIHLSKERSDRVDMTLKKEEDSEAKSLDELRALVEKCKRKSTSFDAASVSRYYNAARTAGYTQQNAHAQRTLTKRCLELLSTSLHKAKRTRTAIDLGCGSGLSAATIAECGKCAVVGVDVSEDMLNRAAADARNRKDAALDFVRADLSQPLPFRSNAFDVATSTSAIHFMCESVGKRSEKIRMETMFRELERCVDSRTNILTPVACQFFSDRGGRPFHRMLSDASKVGNWRPRLVFDRPHRTSANRWFLVLHRGDASRRYTTYACCPMGGSSYEAPCLLQYEASGMLEGDRKDCPRTDDAHRVWFAREHVKYGRRLIRCVKRLRSSASSSGASSAVFPRLSAKEIELGERLMSTFGDSVSLDDLMVRKDAFVRAVHSPPESGKEEGEMKIAC